MPEQNPVPSADYGTAGNLLSQMVLLEASDAAVSEKFPNPDTGSVLFCSMFPTLNFFYGSYQG